MGYRVTAGAVTVETAVPGGRAEIDIHRGTDLPADVPDEQVQRLLAAGHIERVGEAAPEPAGDLEDAEPAPDGPPVGTVAEVLTWVEGDAARAQAALEAEQAKGDKARSTLVEQLTAITQQ